MNEPKTRATSLSTAIFLPNFFLSIIALVALTVVLTLVVGRLTANSMSDRVQTTQRLFLETVSQDYLTGSFAQVYRKCKSLVSDNLIKAVKITDPTGHPICDVASSEGREDWSWSNTAIYHDEAGTQIAAQVSLAYSTAISRQIFLNSLFLILGAILVTALVQLLLSRKLAISLSSPITTLANSLNSEQPGAASVPTYQGRFFRDIREVSILFDSARALLRRIEEYQKELVTKARQAAVGEMAAEVAHNIRSPLAALEQVVDESDELPEEHRVLIRSATSRVRDIANDLLRKNRLLNGELSDQALTEGAEETSTWLLSSLVDSIVSEARYQFRPKIGVEINAKLGNSAYGVFARVSQAKFKAILSNLINNAVEALDQRGGVTVSVAADDARHLLITVEDNGKGIPPEILPKLMQEGQSFRKSGGSGLGLYGARMAVESWSGSIGITSIVGKGTTVTIRLPRAEAPAWFVPSLQIEPGNHVVILDDDASIHQIWQKRFDSSQGGGPRATLHHLTTPLALRDWITGHAGEAATTLFLVDYELLGHQESGLDLIEQHHIAERSILVTSRFEDAAILNRLSQLRIRLIPKGLAPFVPILLTGTKAEASPDRLYDYVLIDDDSMAHKTWEFAAKKVNARIAYFFTAADFLALAAEFAKSTPVYIDSNLGDSVRGEEVSKEIAALGFGEIYLITGYSQAQFPPLPHIRGIRDKRPPW